MTMAKLRLATIQDDKPVKLTIELAAPVHRDLLAYAEAHWRAKQAKAPSSPQS
jgi:hypothetical protein